MTTSKPAFARNSSKTPALSPVSFADAAAWIEQLHAEIRPDLVVGIARGALRFIQLFCGSALPSSTPVLSHSALGYLDDGVLSGARVLVFDDSVVFGSTMASVYDSLVARGAQPTCAAFVVDEHSFYGTPIVGGGNPGVPSPHARVPLRALKLLSPQGVRQHHAALIKAIVSSPRHYSLEFATLRHIGRPFEVGRAFDIADRIARAVTDKELRDVSSATGYAASEYRFTVFLGGAAVLPLIDGAEYRVSPKLRVGVSPASGSVFIAPIVQLAIASGTQKDGIRFSRGDLQSLFERLQIRLDPSDVGYSSCLFRACTAVASIGVLGTLRSMLGNMPVLQELGLDATVDGDDLRLLFGPHNGELLVEALAEIVQWRHASDHPCGSYTGPAKATECDRSTVDRVVAFVHNQPAFATTEFDPAWEVIGKTLVALKEVTDSPTERAASPASGRLDQGLSFAGLRDVARRAWQRELTEDELQASVDYFVDKGLAVPKAVDAGGEITRVFYCGEDEDSQDTLQLKAELHAAYKEYLRACPDRPLDSFDMQKLSVVLKSTLPWIPLTQQPFKHGFVTTPTGDVPRVDWMTQGVSAPFEVRKTGGRSVLVPRGGFTPSVRQTWEPTWERDFKDAFDFVATVFGRVGTDEKLLLSTCRTHRHCYCAMAFELSAWCGLERSAPGFGRIPTYAIHALNNSADAADEALLEPLYWCIRYIAEVNKKFAVFYRNFSRLADRVDRAFGKLGPPTERWWRLQRQNGLLNHNTEPEVHQRVELLLALVGQAERITRFAYRAIIESRLNSDEVVDKYLFMQGVRVDFREYRWLREGTLVADVDGYNRAIEAGKVPGQSLLSTRLEAPTIESGLWSDADAKQSLDLAQQAFSELRDAARLYCPRYEGCDPEFTFLPRVGTRVLRDGSREERRDALLLLVLDIVGSSNSAQTVIVKDRIRECLQAFRGVGIAFQDTGDDGIVAWCDRARPLWDAALAIALRCDELLLAGERFAGTRKALMVGPVAVVTKPNGEQFVRDVRIPNVLNQAFSLPVEIDRLVEEGERNWTVAIEKATHDHIAGELKFVAGKRRAHIGKSKHFSGKLVFESLRLSGLQ